MLNLMPVQDVLPLAHLCMVLAAVLAAHVAFTPPARPQREEDVQKKGNKRDSITRAARWHPIAMKGAIWTFFLCESSLTLSTISPVSLPPLLRDALNIPIPRTHLPPPLSTIFTAGWVLVLLGGLGRALCYRALGRHFTFELALQDGHKLVTHGPYAVVRHPSYSAIVPVTLGLPLVFLGPASWAQTSGCLATTAGSVAALVWVLNLLWLPVALIGRVDMEDEMLRKEFGQEWVEWAKKTPYKLVPSVY